jgi:hypothetical protein
LRKVYGYSATGCFPGVYRAEKERDINLYVQRLAFITGFNNPGRRRIKRFFV